MSFSRRAIERLLPHLERGLALMGNDATDSAIHAAGYLRPDERVANQRQFLPPSPNVTNPIVRQALVEVRKTVNAVLRELVYRQGHTLDEIHVELAREAKKSFAERKQIRFDNADREKAREDAADWIEKEYQGKIKPTRATVNRYLLWQSQEELCPYCCQQISARNSFSAARPTSTTFCRAGEASTTRWATKSWPIDAAIRKKATAPRANGSKAAIPNDTSRFCSSPNGISPMENN